MPTGYTHTLIEKKQSFPQFALTCARAFGAFIHMRDDDTDAPLVPAKVGTYHRDELKKARTQLAALKAMPAAQFRAQAKKARDESATYMAGIRKTYTEQNALLEAMERDVAAWAPPTSDHIGLKTFMLEQIEMSKHDLSPRSLEDPRRPLPTKAQALADLRKDIAYHEKEYAEEVERVGKANDWAKTLKESLS